MAASTGPSGSSKGYRIILKTPDDSQANRDKLGRRIMFVVTSLIIIAVPALVFRIIGGKLGDSSFWTDWMPLFGATAGMLFLAGFAPAHMLVNNAEWTGYVTQNALSGKMVVYGPGLHPTYFWETRNRDNNLPLNVVTRPTVVAVQTTTSRIDAHIELEYALKLERLERAVGLDSSTVDSGLTSYLDSFLSQNMAKETAEDARKKVGDYNDQLADNFMAVTSPSPLTRGMTVEEFGDTYGLRIVSVIIKSLKFPPEVEKSRNALDEAEQVHRQVAKLMGLKPEELAAQIKSGAVGHREYMEMLNRALAISDNAKMNIVALEGDLPAMAKKIVDKFTGGPGPKSPKS